TNDATAVRRFHAESGSGLICKVFGSNAITEHGTTKVAYTHRLDDGDLADLGNVGSTAHQFQDWVHDKHHEARVVVVGDRVFPFLIHADSAAARIDWRTDYRALRYELAELPVSVENGAVVPRPPPPTARYLIRTVRQGHQHTTHYSVPVRSGRLLV
ncbi:MAG: hypothetical protein ACRDRO_22655, partial [Pseudonocardiaceae bacterium]